MGMCGCCSGFGYEYTGGNEMKSPEKLGFSCVHSACSARTVSVDLRTRRWNGTPMISDSSSIQP